ncbi:MAG: alpha-2-macroglobulin family protein [Flavipsychrobacter sp.]|nr:alpha-2-macroglobulin family protein [Flavipsychrobacter sp.]
MKSYLRLSFVLMASLFLYSCGSKNGLEVINRNFTDEVDLRQNLSFSFSKDVYPDSLLQQWDSTAYIEFSPAVKGMFRWNSSNELVFSPERGFEPGTEYKAQITTKVLKRSKKKYSLGKNVAFTFHTAPLRVTAANLSWTRGQAMNNVMVQLDVNLNYEVDVTEAASKIKLSSGGRSIITTTVNSGKSQFVTLQFQPVNELDQETDIKVELLKGVTISQSKYVSARDTAFGALIPSRFNMEVSGISAQHTGTEGYITVNTSQPVLEENLKNYISLEPSVPFEVETEESGFIIRSTQIKADQVYQLTLSTKLEGQFGGKFRQEYSEQVNFGKLEPAISFVNTKGIYISSQGYRNLALNIVNVPKVKVKVVKVYENNMEHFFRRGTDYDYAYDDEDDYHGYETYNTDDLGDVVWEGDYETSKLPRQNSARVLHLDFQDKIKSFDGVYVITVESSEHRWVQQSKILSISDVGLIVKEEKDNIYVFANSIHSATPLGDVSISFISTNNQKLYTAQTDGEGVAIFKNISKQAPGFKVGLITARMKGEFSFVSLRQSRVETSRFDVGGRMPNDAGLNAMIYAERNLYRPGEVMHVSTVVRDELWQLPGEVPVKLRLTMPNGKEFATMRKILNEQGSTETSYALPPTALTGTYVVDVLTGNDVLLNSYNISVEEFIPDRLKAEVKIDKAEYKLGDSVRATVQADNLFGTPAADRNFEMELNLNKVSFTSKQFPDYDFDITNSFNFSTEYQKGQTSATGAAGGSFFLKQDMANLGMLKGNIMATVFDETGRPVHRYENFTVFTQELFAGVKNFDYYVSTKVPMRFNFVAADRKGNGRGGTLSYSIIKKEWHTVIQQDGDRYRYVSQKQEKVVKQQSVTVGAGGGYVTFTPAVSGEYELRLTVAGSGSYVSRTFYAWGYGDTQYTSFDVNNEGNVEIKPDKDKYNTGEDMQLLFTTPFEGRMLVTVERSNVLKYYFINTQNKSASLTLSADDALVPNVYISATLFRPMDASDMPLTVAHGFKSVTVENSRNHLPVQVSLQPKSRSKTKQTIVVKTAPNAYVTVAAVDEGILQIKNYRTPDPYEYFYQKVALGVNAYDIYPLLLPEIKTTRSSTGGDGGDESAMRVNPMFVNRVKNVSFWSGIVQANGSGEVRYDIDIPQFSGDIRVMAFAYKDKAFGGADQHMKVADPVVISTALPRFMSPKDEVVVPVTLSNTTAKDANATVTMQVQGPLGISGSSSQAVKLPANREGRAVFNVAAAQSIGAGKVIVTVKAMGETFTHETEIAVRPTASLQKLTGSGTAAENKTTTVNTTNNFIPATYKGRLMVSKSPLVQFSRNMDYLVRYPYGCVEQTTSAAFPQLYYADLVKAVSGSSTDDINPAYNVQQAVLKLQSMQMSNGSLSYWPGGGYESWWGSVYATHFLLEAKKAGYDVNARTVDRLLEYLKVRLNRREKEILYYNENLKKEIAAKEIAYSLYVLALAGQSQPATMNYYKGHPELLSIDSKYLLAAAYALSGQPTQARQLLPASFSGEKAKQAFGGSFYSHLRDEALALNALMEINPNDPQVPVMVRHIAEQMKNERYLNTQENVFGLLAMGKMARSANKTTATAAILVNGKNIGVMKGQVLTADLKSYSNQPIQVQVKGKGDYYYWWETSGITADGSFKEEDSYMKVRRTYYDREGRAISGSEFKQNDLVVIRISIEGQYNTDIENVVITDMLPAGFEVENSRLTELPGMKWVKDEAEPDYVDIRDDRVNFFTTATGSVKYFYYMVRAVSPGSYQLGPVQADAMYNGAYHSYNGAGVIKVSY